MRTFEFEHVRSFCLSKPHVTESFPFDDHTMVWKVADKVFAIANIYDFKGVSLKCNPERALELRETYAGIRIRGAMLDEIRKGDWAPRSVHRNSRRISNAIKQVESEKNELREKLLQIIEEIPEREGEVLLYRYGLYDLNTDLIVGKVKVLIEIKQLLEGEIITSKQLEDIILNTESKMQSLNLVALLFFLDNIL